MPHSRISLALILGMGSCALLAQTPPPVKDELQELEDLLNTPIQGASKREQRLIDSPQAIEVLTGDEIRQQGIYRLADALKLMTSVDVLDLDNHVTNVTLRGATQQGQPKTVQILIDGVPLYNGEIASVDIDNLPVPIDLIDKVEVVRGPSSSLYGANAVVGVIAITTKRAAEGTHGGARLSAGTHKNVLKNLSLDGWRGAATLALARGGFGLTAGYQGASLAVTDHSTTNINTGGGVRLDENSSHQRNAFMRAELKVGKGSVWLGAGEGYKYLDTFSGANFPYQTFLMRTANAGWQSQWADNFRTEVRWGHLSQKYSVGGSPAFVAVFGPELGSEYTWVDYTSDQVEFQVNWDLSKSIHLVGGIDHRTYSAGKSLVIGFPTDFDESASGGFLNLDWNVTETLAISLGARAENETIGGSRTSPRVAVVWNPTKSSSLRAGWYSSTRSPQVAESRVNFYNPNSFTPPPPLPPPPASRGDFRIQPNPDLEPEKVTSTEIGYRHIIGAFTLDLTAFEMKFEKLIAQVQQGAPTVVIGAPIVVTVTNQYVNTSGAKDRGLEVAASWRASSRWILGANATWLDYTLTGSGLRPTYTPSFKGNAWVRGSYGSFSGYFAFQHIGAVNMEVLSVSGAAAARIPRDAVNQTHANLAWEFLPGASLSVYSRYGLKAYTEQGGGGPTRQAYLHGARRETGVTLGYRF